MCGRFVRKSTIPVIAEEFEIKRVSCDLEPSYNIAPGDNLAVIINDGANYLIQLRWGLIPSWAKDPSIGNKMINARAETLRAYPNNSKKRCYSGYLSGFSDRHLVKNRVLRLLFGSAGVLLSLMDFMNGGKREK